MSLDQSKTSNTSGLEISRPIRAATQPLQIGITDIVYVPVGPNPVWQSRVGAYIAIGRISCVYRRLWAILHFELAVHGRLFSEEMCDGEERRVDA